MSNQDDWSELLYNFEERDRFAQSLVLSRSIWNCFQSPKFHTPGLSWYWSDQILNTWRHSDITSSAIHCNARFGDCRPVIWCHWVFINSSTLSWEIKDDSRITCPCQSASVTKQSKSKIYRDQLWKFRTSKCMLLFWIQLYKLKFLRGIRVLCKKVQRSTVWSFERCYGIWSQCFIWTTLKKTFVSTSGYGMDD